MSYFSLFQSTHPARGATIAAISSGLSTSFQSTHPARGATVRRPPFCFHFDISIHAPREGCDFAPRNDGGMWVISIHAPREGCDCQNQGSSSRMDYFNPRTPRGVRQQRLDTLCHIPRISIHAPREGCDRFLVSATYTPVLFQSTHPARGATANFTKEQRVCLAQFAYLHKGKKAEHTKTNAPMLHEAFLYAFWVRTGRRRRVLLDFARYKIKGSSGR